MKNGRPLNLQIIYSDQSSERFFTIFQERGYLDASSKGTESRIVARVLQAMGKPTVGHLDPYYLRIMDEMQSMLRRSNVEKATQLKVADLVLDTSDIERVHDMRVATLDWLYMTLRRLGRPKEAEHLLVRADPSLDVIENVAYHKLLMMYRGEISVDELLDEPKEGLDRPTILYGIGNWYVYNGQPAKGREIFQRIVDEEPWPAFGTLAAEAELARELK